MLDKKQIWVIFLLKFKVGGKAAETASNVSNTFGPGTANEHRAQWWFKKFCKGDKSLQDEEHNDRPSEIDSNQLRGSSKLILIQLCAKLPQNSASTKNQKIIVLKCHLLLFYATKTNHFWLGFWHATKCGFYMTTSNDHLSGWTKKKLQSTSQTQTCTKNRS